MQRFLVAIGLLCLLGCHAAGAAGFQWAAAPDTDGPPLQIAIWYPSGSTTTRTTIGPFDMGVAMNGTLSAGRHPMIVMSHGTGGMALNSFDTAEALADAGFVVVAITHTGDNSRDHSVSFTRRNFVDRPRHVTRTIDFMLRTWSGRGSIDQGRIGIFGHSAGGATALIAIGGVADTSRVMTFCQTKPDDWGCRHIAQRSPVTAETISAPISGLDTRIKAAVVAAPALAVAFQPDGLTGIKVPVQLWVGAEDDIVRDAALIRPLLPSPPNYHLVPHAGHFAYLAPCDAAMRESAPEICGDPEDFERTGFLRDFQRSVIAFYQQNLK
ncbi:dienelactone hydrolase family protein [Acidisphaera sp. S103]|uniref:alpha/beta hydrolase family protein n=1 Tax=Acidisphaera sp. S103 TaxID=1747223 RepID=UPI00131E5567|nr:dienelactone hydrolase family protein [Acidisphaera sp. S103]